MDGKEGKIIPVAIEDEVKESYLNYAMSVIVSRALPDIRDGLKPVHRRILYSMNEMGLRSDRPYKKTARPVADTLGKYHPHGDQSIYDALVRLAQDFSLRYPVIDGQGNFGSIDGDPPAAMRYTEARMGKLAEEMLRDINKETVDFGPNYDDSMTEPIVLPAGIPFLLINGGSGIAVGMATNIAPHNLKESVNAIAAYIEEPNIKTEALMKHIKGPDFPSGGIILGREGIKDAYKTGRGRIVLRARLTLETNTQGKETIIITELPYQVNKANLIIQIANLVKERRIEGITDLRDESDRHGIRILIELKRGITPRVIINQLFTNTNCQTAFCVNNVALVDGTPKVVNLKEIIVAYVSHRKEVVTRRTKFDLRKAEERAHILEGLKVALENIDEVIAIIKASADVNAARTQLIKKFRLTEIQAQAILDMRLQKLTSLETRKIIEELEELKTLIKKLKDLLSSEQKILGVVKDELMEIAEKYGDERRTEIRVEEAEELDIEDLIIKEDMVILISHQGFIRRVPLSAYRRQGRGGRGATSASRDTDFIEHLFIASTHDYILFVTNEGKAYWLKVHEIPEGSRTSRGANVRTLLSISNDEDITAVVSLDDFSSEKTFFMATCRGVVKRVNIDLFTNAKTRGIIALNLDQQDKLIAAKLTTGDDEIVLVTRQGMALRFHEEAVRVMGRSSRGVRGIRLSKEDEVIGVLPVSEKEEMFIVSQFGFGKRTKYENFSSHGRGTKGQICCKVTEKNGEIAGVLSINKQDDIVCITSKGNTLKVRANEIPVLGKTAVGVKIVSIEKPDIVIGVARAEKE
ncbi:MAG: DNA topoisomerase (ATP-hydrolyzing) subunit A [Spirochaetales bacterium]|nr:DNA topoisomerase (ATP-hydrolyzing) subunit A [Spirochaetales bacterium]